MFDLEKFKTGDYYVHLPTQELHDEAMKFLDSRGFVWGVSRTSLNSLNSQHYWNKYKEDTTIVGEINDGVRYASEQHYISEGYKKLELNERKNMEEKLRKDLIKALFELEFGSRIDYIEQYKGRLISHYSFVTVQIIDFIDKLNVEYSIRGREVAEVIIEEFDIKEYEKED